MPNEASASCRSCQRPIEPGDAYCRYCGASQTPSVPWYLQPVWIILLTFTVLGPFGLPLIWKTPKMSRGLKVVLTSITLAFTIVLVYAAYWVMAFLFQYYGQLNEQLNQMNY